MSNETYQRIFELNRRWVEERNAEDPTFFEKLAREQNPDFLFIGCADSRVPASTIMGVEPGEVFVTRNVANLVVNTDLNVASTINYAVDHLKVKHVVVCGHYGCGGVMAAMQSKDLGVLNGWLREIRDVYRLHRTELDAIADEDQRYRRLVELNVREQCLNVIKTAEVQRNFLERGAPTVHGWVYDLSSGLLKDLNINFEDLLSEVREIYSLTPGEAR
ncbi:carbonic anhydrase [Lujinxingia vulgaris]|uniref:Carbonic anhydrase 2 n=1 Tax=Lujinxingia vulgaris TaxID=2600176 RepID=A0A5C6XH63_9DELT|nr:carbonic anhydrase [Lujinxingia vulgaris]TXD37492.1 carbonic anhydrase [Lujinxingia vulgaris]